MTINKRIKEVIQYLKESGDYILDSHEQESIKYINDEDVSPYFNKIISSLLNENTEQANEIFSHICKKLDFQNKEHEWQKYFFCKSIQAIGYDYTKLNLPKKQLNNFEYHYSITTQEFGKAIAIDYDSFEYYMEYCDYSFKEKELSLIIPALHGDYAHDVIEQLLKQSFDNSQKQAEVICNLDIADDLKFKCLRQFKIEGKNTNIIGGLIKNTDIESLNIEPYYKTSLSITKDLLNEGISALDNYALNDIAEHLFCITQDCGLEKNNSDYGTFFFSREDKSHRRCCEFELELTTEYINNLSYSEMEPFHDYLKKHTHTLISFSKKEQFKDKIPTPILYSLEKNKNIFIDKYLQFPIFFNKNSPQKEIIKYIGNNIEDFKELIVDNYIFILHHLNDEELEDNLLLEELCKKGDVLLQGIENYHPGFISIEMIKAIHKTQEKLNLQEQLKNF